MRYSAADLSKMTQKEIDAYCASPVITEEERRVRVHDAISEHTHRLIAELDEAGNPLAARYWRESELGCIERRKEGGTL
jgi:hypothetical protein